MGFFLYPMTSVCISCSFVSGLFGMLFQDVQVCLVSLMLLFISVRIKYIFPIPSLLMGNSIKEREKIDRSTPNDSVDSVGVCNKESNVDFVL